MRNATFHVGSLTRPKTSRTSRGASPAPSSTSSASANDRLGFRTHRRLSSYPEVFPASRRRAAAKRSEQQQHQADGIEMQPLSPPTVKLRSTRPRGHRRISSTSALAPREADAELTEPAALVVKTAQLRPSVTFAPPVSPDPGTVADNDGEDEELAAHVDEDDDDDYYASHPHVSPLQLLNQAMEHGVRSAARQYRRRNLATTYHQRSAVGEGEGEAVVWRKSGGVPRPPLAKQTTVDSTAGGGGGSGGVLFDEDPLAYAKVRR